MTPEERRLVMRWAPTHPAARVFILAYNVGAVVGLVVVWLILR